MGLDSKIKQYKKNLIKKALKNGLYENFGQHEVGKLKDNYIDISSYTDEMNIKRKKIQDFNKWSMNFNDNDLEKFKNKSVPLSVKQKGKKGWKSESVRHSLARKGIKTGRKKKNNDKEFRKLFGAHGTYGRGRSELPHQKY